MALNLADETAIVTGAASGIGRKTAERFAAEGANVVAADVTADAGEETVDRIEAEGGNATFVETDVTDPDAVAAMVETARNTYGSVDIAHNNAGVEGDDAALADQSAENWDRVLGINLKGVWLCLKHEIDAMTEDGGGAIVNTASIAGLAAAGAAPYVASKHGVVGLTRTAASEYADAGVRVNAVCPGVIDTPMVDRAGAEDPEAIQGFVAMQPLGRKGTPEEVANAVVWLASGEASFVTGNAYPVDGGYMAL